MSKSKSSSVSQTKLFRDPVPYEAKPRRKMYLVVMEKSSNPAVVKTVCVEDSMKSIIPLDYQDVSLSNLVDKGVDPHSLDLIDSSKLGCDEGIDKLASHLISNSGSYVLQENPISEN